MYDLLSDLRYALRQMRRAPVAAAFLILTLAIGIGANVTMAGIIDRLLLRPPPGVDEPERVVRLLYSTPGAPQVGHASSYPQLLDLQHEVPAFEGVAGESAMELTLGTGANATSVTASLVSPSYFQLLGVTPSLGRVFSTADAPSDGVTPGGYPVAVLSNGLWKRQFGGDPGVVGRSVHVGKSVYTIIGVAPPRFRGITERAPDLWLPLHAIAGMELEPYVLEDRSRNWLTLFARLKDGQARATAEAQATAVARRSAPSIAPYRDVRVIAASLVRGRGPDAPREVRVALWLSAIAAMVLLIACANIANLLLARAFSRRREIAVRLALGASRARISRQLLTEIAILTALGGGCALIIAEAGGVMVQRFFLSQDFGESFVDDRIIAIASLVTLATGVLVGLVPLARSGVRDLGDSLRLGTTSGGGRTSRLRSALLGTQAALCMLLLVLAGLFSQSLRRVSSLDLGMDVDRTIVARFSFDDQATTPEQSDATWTRIVAAVKGVPGVRQASVSASMQRAVAVHTKKHDVWDVVERSWQAPYEIPVDSGYFTTLGTKMTGRDFSSSDVSGAGRVAIINEPLARLLFPGENALGKCVFLPMTADERFGDCWTVVGVLGGYWYPRSILDRDGLLVYVPIAQRPLPATQSRRVVVATTGPAGRVVNDVRRAILRERPDVSRLRVESMRDLVAPEMRPWRLGATMFSLFGGVALIIAAVGLYSVVSFTAAQRASEIAVRVALGAGAHRVVAAVAGDGLRAVAGGLVIWAAIALGIRHWIGPLLFQTAPGDPVIMLGVAGLLLFVAAVAIMEPTRRALRQDPAAILRVD